MKSTQKTPPVMMRALTSNVSVATAKASEYVKEISQGYALLEGCKEDLYQLKKPDALPDLCIAGF